MPQVNMKAALCSCYGPPEVVLVAQIPQPRPGERELLIRIRASAVNSADVRVRGLAVKGLIRWIMRLVLGITGPRKQVLGTVLAGTVVDTGKKVQGFKVGDDVFGMTGFKFGTHAEYIALKENAVLALKPEKASYEESAAILFGGSTAIHFLLKRGPGSIAGKNILIYGAAGSVGTSAIQIARYHGADVTAVTSGKGMDLVRNLGAVSVINYEQDDFLMSGKQYDIVFDAAGRTTRKQCRPILKTGGRFLTTGGLEVAAETREQLKLLRKMYDEGHLNAVIDRTFSLNDIARAHQYVESGVKKGNVVITV